MDKVEALDYEEPKIVDEQEDSIANNDGGTTAVAVTVATAGVVVGVSLS